MNKKGWLKPMNRKYPHFAIPEIYGESLSYYELLRKLVKAMNIVIENYDTIPDQIAEAVKDLDASQLFSAVLDQIIDSIATDNTKSTNAVKVYKKHDLLYATFNETVNLYESLIDFTAGTETELIIGTNIREVNISELFIELRKLIDDESNAREQGDHGLQTNIDNEAQAREQADATLQTNIDNEAQAREQADATLQTNIDNEAQAREQADATKANKSDVLTLEEIQASSDLIGKIASASALKDIKCITEFKNLNFVNGVASTNLSFNNVVILNAFEVSGWDNLNLVPYIQDSDKLWYIKDINGKHINNINVLIIYIKRG